MSFSNDFELNVGLRGPFLEYLPENRSTLLDGPWPNSGSASGEWWDLDGDHVNADGVTKHFWKREVYTNEAYAAIEPGSEEIDMPTFGELWEQLGGRGSRDWWTYAFRIGDLDNILSIANYVQTTVEITNAEYESSSSTVADSIKRMFLGYNVRNAANSRVIQQNGQLQELTTDGWDSLYNPGVGDTDWSNSTFVITGKIGSGAGSARLWKNGVELTLDQNDWAVEVDSDPGLLWVDEFDATWGAYDAYPNRFTGANNPDNATVDAILTLMEGCHTAGSDTPPSNNNNGVTHMAFYRGEARTSDAVRITNQWA